MKNVYLIALLLLTPSLLAFAQRRVESTPRPKSDLVAKVPTAAPLLDISMTSSAMGRTSKQPLYFRLYESGRLEYEVWQKTDSDAGNAKQVLVKKEIQLSKPTVKEFIRLAEEPDFLNARDGYSSLVRALDWSVVTTVVYSHRGREKRIAIRNYRPLHPKAESFYPKSLVKLLARVDELRAKDH